MRQLKYQYLYTDNPPDFLLPQRPFHYKKRIVISFPGTFFQYPFVSEVLQMLKDTGSLPENTNFGIKASVVKSVLDSSSVDTPKANTSAISKSQLGKMITDGTYYISCWMTLAQIEKVRSKKVLFSELD